MAVCTSSALKTQTPASYLSLSQSRLSTFNFSDLPSKFPRVSQKSLSRCPSISCVVTRKELGAANLKEEMAGRESGLHLRPDSLVRFGNYGGKYVPETLMYALTELETAFHSLAKDTKCQDINDN